MTIVRSLVCGEGGSWEWSEEVALGEGCQTRFWGRGCDEALFSEKKGFSVKRGQAIQCQFALRIAGPSKLLRLFSASKVTLFVGRFMTVKLESAQALSRQTSCCHVHRGCETFGIVCNGAGSA